MFKIWTRGIMDYDIINRLFYYFLNNTRNKNNVKKYIKLNQKRNSYFKEK